MTVHEGPRVLVAFASRHGATREIAAAVVRGLLHSDAGRWLEPARRYVEEVAPQLRSRPTWLFTSELDVGSPGTGHDVEDARCIGDAIGARDHRFFAGRLDRRLLTVAERYLWSRGPAAAGGFREWASVRGRAEEVAAHLAGRSIPAVPAGR